MCGQDDISRRYFGIAKMRPFELCSNRAGFDMICVSVGAKTESELLSQIEKAGRKGNLIEARLDMLKDPLAADLEKIIKACKKKVIVTARPKREGGIFKLGEAERIGLLANAAKAGADYIDVEFSTGRRLLNSLIRQRKGAKIILSFHNFKNTPRLEELMKIYSRMRSVRGVSIIKIVAFARRESDNLAAIGLLREAQKHRQKMISFCMGPKGKISRVLALLDGSFLTYASLGRGSETAQGQIPAVEMMKIYKNLGAGALFD